MTNTAQKFEEMTTDELLASFKTKSACIRYLDSLGWNRSKIATKLNIRYQHVRNVLTQELKKGTTIEEPKIKEQETKVVTILMIEDKPQREFNFN